MRPRNSVVRFVDSSDVSWFRARGRWLVHLSAWRQVSEPNSTRVFMPACNTTRSVWGPLCQVYFIQKAELILGTPSKHLIIVQIKLEPTLVGTRMANGDPLIKGMTFCLRSLSQERRHRIDYTMVEASPIKHQVLEKKIQEHSCSAI